MGKKSKKSAARATAVAVPSRHPKLAFGAVTQVGLKAHALATAHKKDLERRLPPGLVGELELDLGTLGTLVPGALSAHETSAIATHTQDAALEKVHARAVAIRHAIAKSDLPKAVRKLWGVGRRRNAHLVKDVLAEADVILGRAVAAPHEAREAGILDEDLGALEVDRVTAAKADQTQEHERAAAPESTRARNEAAWRVIRAASRIAAAGLLAYATRKAESAPFDALRHEAAEHKSVLKAHADEPSAPAPGSQPAAK